MTLWVMNDRFAVSCGVRFAFYSDWIATLRQPPQGPDLPIGA
jgi:hypothetical protein